MSLGLILPVQSGPLLVNLPKNEDRVLPCISFWINNPYAFSVVEIMEIMEIMEILEVLEDNKGAAKLQLYRVAWPG